MTNESAEIHVIDYIDGFKTKETPTKTNTKPLPESFGRNIDTTEKARLWLTNPHNWHVGRLFTLKWNGLLCTISEEHGRRLLQETWDDGLPWAAMTEQKRRRAKHAVGESMEETETMEEE